LTSNRGRPPGRGKKVDPVLPPDAHASLVLLATRKRLGTTTNEVARYLILRALSDLTREGFLPPDPIDRPEHKNWVSWRELSETERAETAEPDDAAVMQRAKALAEQDGFIWELGSRPAAWRREIEPHLPLSDARRQLYLDRARVALRMEGDDA